MRRRYADPKDYFRIERERQISDAHCGPAVVKMLLSNLGIAVTQEAVAQAGGAEPLIHLHGMRVDQLAEAVRQLAPGTQFWYKEKSSLKDLVRLINEHKYPVGVEWQGIFDDVPEDEDDSEDQSEDYGHFSIVTFADADKRELIIVDPYKSLIERDRILRFNTFANRWWDINQVPDPVTGRDKYVEDEHLLFIITPKDEAFPLELGMKRY